MQVMGSDNHQNHIVYNRKRQKVRNPSENHSGDACIGIKLIRLCISSFAIEDQNPDIEKDHIHKTYRNT